MEAGIDRLWREIRESVVAIEADDSVNWLSLGVDDADQLELRPLLGGLYAGTSGLAAGLLSYRSFTGDHGVDKMLRSIEREAAASYERYRDSAKTLFSYYDGALGHLAAVRALSAEGIGDTDADRLTNDFLSRCIAMPLDRVDTDVISGVAGTIIALATLPSTNEVQAAVEKLANHLISLHASGWVTEGPRAIDNASFAHGSSGVATALLHAAAITGRVDFLEQWRSAWKHDERFRQGHSWLDMRREDGEPSANWCHGLTGLMLARQRWLDLDSDHDLLSRVDRAAVEDEFQDAAEGVEHHGMLLDSFCLCHGVSGNLLALEMTGHRHRTSSWDDEWSHMVGFGIERGWLCGLSDHFQSYAVMTGLPGILHALSEHAMVRHQNSPLLIPSLDWAANAR